MRFLVTFITLFLIMISLCFANEAKKDIVNETLDKYISPLKTNPDKKMQISENFPQSSLPSLLKSLSALFFILGIILLSFWGFKKIIKRGMKNISGQMIKVIALHHLSPRQMIAVVDIIGERLVLGITPNQITTLAKLNTSKVDTEFAVNFRQEALKTENAMSQMLAILKEKMGELKRI